MSLFLGFVVGLGVGFIVGRYPAQIKNQWEAIKQFFSKPPPAP